MISKHRSTLVGYIKIMIKIVRVYFLVITNLKIFNNQIKRTRLSAKENSNVIKKSHQSCTWPCIRNIRFNGTPEALLAQYKMINANTIINSLQ